MTKRTGPSPGYPDLHPLGLPFGYSAKEIRLVYTLKQLEEAEHTQHVIELIIIPHLANLLGPKSL